MLDRRARRTQRAVKSDEEIAKACRLAMTNYLIVQQENQQLKLTNNQLSQKRQRKKKAVQRGGVISVTEGQEAVEDMYIEDNRPRGGQGGPGKKRQPYRCSKCKSKGHRKNNCPIIT